MSQKISELGLNLIMSFEGFSATPYKDSANVWTIGYGHTSGVTENTPEINQQQAVQYLEQDVQDAEDDVVNTITAPLSQGQFDALVSITYNVGTGPINKTLGNLINTGNYKAAAEEFLKWTHAGGQVIPGLVRRREAERKLFLSQT